MNRGNEAYDSRRMRSGRRTTAVDTDGLGGHNSTAYRRIVAQPNVSAATQSSVYLGLISPRSINAPSSLEHDLAWQIPASTAPPGLGQAETGLKWKRAGTAK